MKKLTFLFVLISFMSASAQEERPAPEKFVQPRVSKGYYTIGDNAGKLPSGITIRSSKTNPVGGRVQKGYYSIDTKSQPQTVHPLPNKADKPKKGYYSIGENQ